MLISLKEKYLNGLVLRMNKKNTPQQCLLVKGNNNAMISEVT